jgi:short-subunit dehydrogenase
MTSERKTVVITGATAGVGRETVRLFAKNGYDVALLARGEAGLAAASREVESLGQRCLAIVTDVADFNQVDRAATRVESELGAIDVWVNNAMTTIFSPLADIAPDDFERAIRVTFLGQVWGTMAALKRMRSRDEGAIINVGSALSFVGIPLQSAYCASKFACRGFFEATRAELLHDRSHVRLSMVQLPAMNTPQFDWCETTMDLHPRPVPPIYQPEIAAQAIFNSAIDGKRSRIVGSWNKMLVVMDSLSPGLGNHYAALGAWNSQLTKQPVKADRPSNLTIAADNDIDYGGHGIFDNRAGGVKDLRFFLSLPKVAFTYLRAFSLNVQEKIAVRKRAELHRQRNTSFSPPSPPNSVTQVARARQNAEPPHSARSIPCADDAVKQTNGMIPEGATLICDVKRSHEVIAEQTSLDVLENENSQILEMLSELGESSSSSVEDPYVFGNLAKELLRHFAIRQASLMDVGAVISTIPELHDIGSRLIERATHRRRQMDEVFKMARAVQPISLNVGQDFNAVFEPLVEAVKQEIEWEGDRAIHKIREVLVADSPRRSLQSAQYIRHHAPTYLSTKGPRWYEHAPVVSRLFTMYEHLNDFPRASSESRSS